VSTIDDGSLLSVCGSALAQSATTPTSATAAAVFGALAGEATADRAGDTAWTAGDTAWTTADAAWLTGEAAAVGVASDAAAEPSWPA
jgi:hypothetical protein